jgi:hypothetical protein
MRFQNFCEFLAAVQGFAAAESWRFIRLASIFLRLSGLILGRRPALEERVQRIEAWLRVNSPPAKSRRLRVTA